MTAKSRQKLSYQTLVTIAIAATATRKPHPNHRPFCSGQYLATCSVGHRVAWPCSAHVQRLCSLCSFAPMARTTTCDVPIASHGQPTYSTCSRLFSLCSPSRSSMSSIWKHISCHCLAAQFNKPTQRTRGSLMARKFFSKWFIVLLLCVVFGPFLFSFFTT